MVERRFQRGDRVNFKFGLRFVEGEVIEDRGPIGVGGRRLYGIRFQPDVEADGTFVIELPAGYLGPASGVTAAK